MIPNDSQTNKWVSEYHISLWLAFLLHLHKQILDISYLQKWRKDESTEKDFSLGL